MKKPKVAPAELAWPGAVAVAAIAVLNLLLPKELSAEPGWIGLGMVAVLTIGTLLSHPYHEWLGHANSVVTTIFLARSLWGLVDDLTHHKGRPQDLLIGAVLVWSMNILVFAAWYWRLDSGGPHQRATHEAYCGGAFLFPQLTLPEEVREEFGMDDWKPRFVDYLFLAFNTSTAFSPTDVPVLSGWAKVLMMIQASISLATLAMVAARAVNIL
jgi:hypothetical protein